MLGLDKTDQHISFFNSEIDIRFDTPDVTTDTLCSFGCKVAEKALAGGIAIHFSNDELCSSFYSDGSMEISMEKEGPALLKLTPLTISREEFAAAIDVFLRKLLCQAFYGTCQLEISGKVRSD